MTMPELAPDLLSDLHSARAWLTQATGQLLDNRASTLDLREWMAELNQIAGLRNRLEASGVHVPAFREARADPLGAMMDWRDFLDGLLSLN